MKLLADSGSTKCDWVLISPKGKEFFRTIGLNPTTLSPDTFQSELQALPELQKIKQQVKELVFYGSGCSEKNMDWVKIIFKNYFPKIQEICIDNDLMASAKSTCGDTPGIVGILGTGSNLCHYNGTSIHSPLTSLGYILGDEGSGNAIGKQLLKDYFYGKMPEQYRSSLHWDEDISKLYHADRANLFLANKVKESHAIHETSYFKNIVREEFHRFFELYIPHLKAGSTLHFVGSIAFHFKYILQESCEENGFKLGKVIQSPIQNLQ